MGAVRGLATAREDVEGDGGMTAMDELVAWLRAQLDEDEQLAVAAVEAEAAGVGWGAAGALVEFIETWTPARALLQVAATRRLLDQYDEMKARAARNQLTRDPVPRFMVSWLMVQIWHEALAYAGRDGYRPEWTPQ